MRGRIRVESGPAVKKGDTQWLHAPNTIPEKVRNCSSTKQGHKNRPEGPKKQQECAETRRRLQDLEPTLLVAFETANETRTTKKIQEITEKTIYAMKNATEQAEAAKKRILAHVKEKPGEQNDRIGRLETKADRHKEQNTQQYEAL